MTRNTAEEYRAGFEYVIAAFEHARIIIALPITKKRIAIVTLRWYKRKYHRPPFNLQGKRSEKLPLSRNCDGWKNRYVIIQPLSSNGREGVPAIP